MDKSKSTFMYEAGLVLEGGGMKGVYTAGVLDYFLEKGISFSKCYGVSAGACHLCSFLSGQKGRAFDVVADYLDDRRYCSVYNVITTGDLFRVSMCYDDIPNKLNPYDYEAFNAYKGRAYAVETNIRTGLPAYIRLADMHRDIKAVQASASLPLVSRNVEIGGELYLDGGISDSVPIMHSIAEGNRKNVVVLTKETGYRRYPAKHMALLRLRYRKYPKLCGLLENRHTAYNGMLDYLDAQVNNGQAFVIRPKKKSGIGRIEKDKKKLKELYEEGYRDAAESFEALVNYLEG